ncbi:MAG: nucleotidyltransferase domain-containing protein [Syntrophorhabdales bacterium]|jgi:predicted nucleotidyltransferase
MAEIETIEDVKKQILATLAPYLDGLHSVVLIGSWAHGAEEEGSDVDVVVICKQEAYKRVSQAIWNLRMSTVDEQPDFAYDVCDQKRIREPFTLGSPYANAIRHGLVLIDDGFFRALVRNPEYPLSPGMAYYAHAFRRFILPWFLDVVIRLDRQIREDHGPGGICADGECLSHTEGDILAMLISRMLYITLPSRGYLPLSKKQLLDYSLKVYGADIRAPLAKAVEIARENRAADYDEYRLLRPVARKLLREVVSLLDKRTCRQIFDEARGITRKHYKDYSLSWSGHQGCP